jgi:DNA-binding transcriptional LysR family regulator
MYDLNSMATFTHVVREGSFSAAAKKLNTSRSAVSKAIARLEQELGARLLHRNTRHISLTEIGAAFFDHCHRIVDEAEQAEQMVESFTAKPRGTLKIAVSVAFGTLHIAPAMADFLEHNAELDIDLIVTDKIEDLAGEGYDLAITVTNAPPLPLVARRLAPVRRILCATPRYFQKHGVPLKPQDLRSHNCLDYTHSGDRGVWRFRGPEGDIAVPVAGRLRVNDDEALSQVVLGGLGCALLPTFIVGKDLQEGRLQSVLSEYIPVEQHVYAIWLPNKNLPLKARVFIDFLVERFGAEPYWDEKTSV